MIVGTKVKLVLRWPHDSEVRLPAKLLIVSLG